MHTFVFSCSDVSLPIEPLFLGVIASFRFIFHKYIRIFFNSEGCRGLAYAPPEYVWLRTFSEKYVYKCAL